MRWITTLCLLALSFHALADASRENLLPAWEKLQKSSPEVAKFKKLGDKQYRIEFAHMPYAGRLKVLAYNIEKLDYQLGDTPYTHSGYVEVDLVDTSAKQLNKFNRSYGQWLRTNTLFYNQESNSWDSWAAYRQLLEQRDEDVTSKATLLLGLLDYWGVLLFAIVLCFVFAAIRADKRMKKSMVLQEKALEDFKSTERLAKESVQLQQENNELLAEMLVELKKQSSER